MITVVITEKGGAQRRLEFDKPEITIGRTKGNDIMLPKGNVSKRHSRIVLKDGRFIVVDLKSTNGTYVNGRKITSPVVVRGEDKVYVGDFVLSLVSDVSPGSMVPGPMAASSPPSSSSAVGSIQPSAPPRGSMPGDEVQAASPFTSSLPPAVSPSLSAPPPGEPLPPLSVRPSTAPRSLAGREKKGRVSRLPWSRFTLDANFSKATDLNAALRLLMAHLNRSFDNHQVEPTTADGNTRRTLAEKHIDTAMQELETQGLMDERIDRDALAEAAFHEALGLGTLERLLTDRQIQELLIKGPQHIFADFGNGLKPLECITYSSHQALETAARRLFAQAGISFQPDKPIQQMRLPDGSQVTLWQRAIAPHGPILRIRRVKGLGISTETLLEQGMLSEDMLLLLKQALQHKCKILLSGPPRSGVSTLLSALGSLLARTDWILSVESDVSLDIQHDQMIALTRGDAFDQAAAATVLTRANQFHYDWIVVDDLAGAETFDILESIATKSVGALLGLHASGVNDPLQVLATMAQFHVRAPASMTPLITDVLQLIVELDIDQEGKSFIKSIQELVSSRGDSIKSQNLFVFQDGEFVATGKPPKFLDE